MKKTGYTRRDFEKFFAGEMVLSRAWKHLAQSYMPWALPAWVQGNRDAQWMVSRLLNEISEERLIAVAERRPRRRMRGGG